MSHLNVMIDEIHFANISSVSELIKNKDISPLELTEYMLRRIEKLDVKLKSYATVCADHAIDSAKEAENEIMAGNYRGILHGIPVAVKDLCYTLGIRTMGGLKVRRDFIPDFDSRVVEKLHITGAILLGKTALTEGALSGYNPEFDIPLNPWGEKLWSGVSSSGSGVAVAAGLCFGALGTDTGGSIRYPSMANGVVGLKPTYGRVSRHGVMELAGSLDHVGPIARSVKDTAIMFEAIAGKDDLDLTTIDEKVPSIIPSLSGAIANLSIGVDSEFIEAGTDAGLVEAINNVIDTFVKMGAAIIDVNMPRSDPVQLRNLWLPITGFEAAKAHADTFPSRANDYGGYLRSVLELGASMDISEYQAAMKERHKFVVEFEAELSKADAVICPAGGFVFEVDKAAQYGDRESMQEIIKNFQGQFTIPADLAGTPALAMPCGFSDDGRPYTFQLLGTKLSEEKLCMLGHAYEQQFSWSSIHPDL
jgi:amidase